MPKYSIIVPVYNMSALLPKCIESLRAQQCDDMEIIFVDDASTDNSYQICKAAEKEDKRIRVVQQDRNRGLSSTRNLGMKHAKGEYLTFVDSDDYVEPDFISTVIEKSKDYFYDMIAWGMYSDVVYSDGHIEISASDLNYPNERIAKNATEEDWKILMMDTFFASTCMRFYKTEIIKQYSMQFDTRCVDFEDYVFNIAYCKYAESYIILDKAFYHYRQPAGQIATIKRKWATVEPFAVSNIVYQATADFFRARRYQVQDSKRIYFYVYKSYCNEIEYAYRTLKYPDFVRRVKKLAKNQGYLDTLEQLKGTDIRKYVRLNQALLHMRLFSLFGTVEWLMQRRVIGKNN